MSLADQINLLATRTGVEDKAQNSRLIAIEDFLAARDVFTSPALEWTQGTNLEKLNVNTKLLSIGKYLLTVSFSSSPPSSDRKMITELIVDGSGVADGGSLIIQNQTSPSWDNTQLIPYSKRFVLDFTSDGTHSIVLRFRCSYPTTWTGMANAVITIEKFTF